MATGVRHPDPLDFTNAQESWSDWIKRFQRFRQASGLNEKSASRQVDTLIYVMGDEAEKVFAQLTILTPSTEEATANPSKLYDNTVEAFNNYFNPTSNTLHYQIIFGSCVQVMGQTNEQFIRELYELISKCGFTPEQQNIMLKMRLLAGMEDKALSRELQLDADVTVDTIKAKMRAKETILRNQQLELDGEKTVASLQWRSNPTTQKSLGRGLSKGESDKNRSSAEPDRTRMPTQSDFIKNCKYCGGSHAIRRCPAYGKRCKNCKRFNHFYSVCQSNPRKMHAVDVSNEHEERESNAQYLNLDTLCLFVHETKAAECNSKWLIKLRANNQTFEAKVDTGAEVSVMSRTTAKSLGVTRVKKSTAVVTGYAGKSIPLLGTAEIAISVVHAGRLRKCKEVFYVVEQNSQTLLGMPAINAMQLIANIGQVGTQAQSGASVIDKYEHVFNGLGKYPKPITLQLKEGAVPKASPPRMVPDKVRSKLEAELKRMETEQIIVRDNNASEWLSPSVIVNKPDGSIRLCLDPQYLNSQLVRTQCCLSTQSEIFSRIHGSKYFSCLDGKQGFHQLVLDEKSSKLTCFLTPFGKFKYLRLPMGITNAPEIFHQLMVDLLKGIAGVEVYIDDVLIHAKTLDEHDARLEAVLERLAEAGITLNKAKSVFLSKRVVFSGP